MNRSKMNASAVLVSVGEHSNTSIGNPLGSSVDNDAFAIANVLKETGGYDDKRIHRIQGPNATSIGISDAIKLASQGLQAEGPFFFYFSGHGVQAADGTVLMTYDFDPGASNSGYTAADFGADLSRVPSRRKFLIIDACFAGGLSNIGALSKSSRIAPKGVWQDLANGEGTVLMASSRQTEESLILNGDTLSLFTKHIVLGLRGGAEHDQDGIVRVFDLFNYVAEEVRREAPQQAPIYAAYHQDSNFAIAYAPPVGHKSKYTYEGAKSHCTTSLSAVDVFSTLYPLGPTDQEIWARAGGDLSRLQLSDTPRTMWFRAMRDISQGSEVTLAAIIQAALEDYPLNRKLATLLSGA